jgi:hypothetical protein
MEDWEQYQDDEIALISISASEKFDEHQDDEL